MRFRGQNPVYKYGNYEGSYDSTNSATYGGVTTKTATLLGIVAIVALYYANTLDYAVITSNMIITLIACPIIAIIAVIVTHRNPQIAFISSIVYAIVEGVFLGFLSKVVAIAYGGELVQMALIGTFGVLAGMLFLYSTGIIRVGSFFRRAMFSMLIGLIISSIVMVVLYFVGVDVYGSSLYFGIVILSVVISSLYLLVDFDTITRFVESGAPKEYEWSLSLGLTVTIIWVYIEILRLLVILAGRRR